MKTINMKYLSKVAVIIFLIQGLANAQGKQQPNVLFITSDDLGLQLSCYGDQVIETPHLDALAASGVQFDVAYVAQASCSPSRSAMLTGLYPHANGQYGLTAVVPAASDPRRPLQADPQPARRFGDSQNNDRRRHRLSHFARGTLCRN